MPNSHKTLHKNQNFRTNNKSSDAKRQFRTLDSSRPSKGRISPLTRAEEVKRTSGVCERAVKLTLICIFTAG